MSQLSLGLPSTLHVQSQRGTHWSQLQTRTVNVQRMGITSREPGTIRGTARIPHFSRAFISETVQLWTQVFWVISVYFNIRNTLPKSGTFLLGHPVYMKCIFTITMPQTCIRDIHVKLYVFCTVTVDEHSYMQRSQKFWKANCLLLDNGEAQRVYLYNARYKYTGDQTAWSPGEKSWLVTNHW